MCAHMLCGNVGLPIVPVCRTAHIASSMAGYVRPWASGMRAAAPARASRPLVTVRGSMNKIKERRMYLPLTLLTLA